MAILLVLVMHVSAFLSFQGTLLIDRVVARVAASGWRGVDLFFVLSGFLITGILLETREAPNALRNFFARRALRIFPLYYAFLFAYFVVLPAIEVFTPPDLGERVWYWTYLTNIRLAFHPWTPGSRVEHFWSLAVEEQFYLLWPFVVRSMRPPSLAKLCLLLIASCTALRVLLEWRGFSMAAFTLMPSRMDGLCAGAWLSVWMRRREVDASLRKRMTLVGALCVIGCAISVAMGTSALGHSLSMTFFALACAAWVALTVTARPESMLSRAMCNRVLVAFGKYSYGIYVFQQAVIFALGDMGLRPETLPQVAGSELPAFLLMSVLATAVTFVIALLSFHLFESRFLALKRFFESGGTEKEVLRPQRVERTQLDVRDGTANASNWK